jgi:hypothetical protein
MAHVPVVVETEDGAEILWATPLGGERYRLENSPSLAYGLSWLDVVEAEPGSRGRLHFTRVVEKSGHRTLRVRIGGMDGHERASLLSALNDIGCSYEGELGRVLAIDVPPGAALDRACALLVDATVEWEYADPPLETLFPTCVR